LISLGPSPRLYLKKNSFNQFLVKVNLIEEDFKKIEHIKNGVDGVYSADPKLDSTATKYDKLSYMDIMNKGLTIMDSTAITFCMDNHLPIIVFSIDEADNIVKVVSDSNLGTIIE